MDKDTKKLNLGCGKKILEGYTNVDLNPKADVVCDITKLPKEWTEQYDEAMAIHVIEHIYPWDVEQTLLEWKRVLKPGGKLILECPDLIKVSLLFLKDPNVVRLGMWGFYGDNRSKDPLMCHKWGYTPKSLETLLRAAGFDQIKHMKAQYHLPERDMRIEAIKWPGG